MMKRNDELETRKKQNIKNELNETSKYVIITMDTERRRAR